ncbi:MAG: hypothetical protein JW751_15180 [Polyangiaceae bacterium]|nr:hypothetical protein [Polyangiaceae bacterium]
MSARTWALSEDLTTAWVVVVVAVGVLSLAVLSWELGRLDRRRGWVAIIGMLATLTLGGAVLRPVSIETHGSVVGARVVVLVDGSRRLLLPLAGETSRRDAALEAVAALREHFDSARLTLLEFGDDRLEPFTAAAETGAARSPRMLDSDLVTAIRHLGDQSVERPQAIVVVSDGRLTRPGEDLEGEPLSTILGGLDVPIHTVAITHETPADSSILRVDTAGAVVAHQPFELRVEVACVGGLRCGTIPVRVRELRLGADPVELASGRAEPTSEPVEVALSIALERAGARVLEVALDPPHGDTISDNNRRYIAFDVARDRIRLLHVAGRPSYDARALRMWLKGDESVDLVAFFILRSDFDDTQADESELALIPFPVDELFTQHLPSFDAVILQDIDAVTSKLARHLSTLARYVETGGGLIMVGGPSAFSGGQYAGTELERVLPVTLPEARQYFDATDFVPRYSTAGRTTPILRALRDLLGDELPSLPGANLLGPARSQAMVLWEHPLLSAAKAPMPVLALGEAGDGRAIALAVDGTHRLGFGKLASDVGGRSYGAAWDGLLGWLMRDPRYEPARIRLAKPCIADEPMSLEVVSAPGMSGAVEVSVDQLGTAASDSRTVRAEGAKTGTVAVPIPPLGPGGYVARARVGASPPMRFEFACERAGGTFADVRPDVARLRRIAEATRGVAVGLDGVRGLPQPTNVRVAAERHVAPWLPAWIWSAAAATLLGLYWFARRRGGLT